MKTACFTGPRPDKLGVGYSITNQQTKAYSDLLEKVLLTHIREGYTSFISGGAIGWDQIAFWTVERLKRRNFPLLENILAIPFKDQPTVWKNNELVSWYHQMIKCATNVIYVDEVVGYNDHSVPVGSYSSKKMLLRNQYMVDHSDLVIAMFDGSSGGTAHCVNYAYANRKEVLRLSPILFK